MVMSGFGIPGEIKVFLNHIYEYKKGVRNMILCTLNEYYLPEHLLSQAGSGTTHRKHLLRMQRVHRHHKAARHKTAEPAVA